jgi:type VI secretion system protein ImpC
MGNNPRDRFEFHLTAGDEPQPAKLADDEPYRIALIGDFSGRSRKEAIAQRRPLIIDPDNFESVLRRLRVELEFPDGRLPVTDLDDFHPDRIFANLPAFVNLRSVRERLEDPATFASAARELVGELPPALRPRPSGASLLEEMLGGPVAPAAPKPVDDLQSFIDHAVRPYLETAKDPRAPELIRRVDGAAGQLMRSVLQDSQFRAIEGAWRSVWFLLQRLETGTHLKLYLYDLAKEEMAAETKAVYDLLIRRSDPFSLMVVLHSFGVDDCGLLAKLGAIARKAGAPLLGEADASLLGAPEWDAFRKLPEAGWVGLGLPRVLLRLPYGKDTDPVDAFPFEEIDGAPDPRQMLYGSPAIFCALAAAGGAGRDVDGLPVYTYQDDGEARAFPCVEVSLTEETAEALLDSGIMPVVGIRNSDSVRVLRLQSAADPPAALRLR